MPESLLAENEKWSPPLSQGKGTAMGFRECFRIEPLKACYDGLAVIVNVQENPDS